MCISHGVCTFHMVHAHFTYFRVSLCWCSKSIFTNFRIRIPPVLYHQSSIFFVPYLCADEGDDESRLPTGTQVSRCIPFKSTSISCYRPSLLHPYRYRWSLIFFLIFLLPPFYDRSCQELCWAGFSRIRRRKLANRCCAWCQICPRLRWLAYCAVFQCQDRIWWVLHLPQASNLLIFPKHFVLTQSYPLVPNTN